MNARLRDTANDIAPYLIVARRFAMLSAAEEKELFARWREREDQQALQRLIGSHLRLVIKIARKNSGYRVPLGDLIAEGEVGLMQAAHKFDPDRGARFATYAAWWIRATIQEYVLHQRSLVKMGTTAAQKKLFFNLNRLKTELQVYGQGDLAPEIASEIATTLDVPESEVIEMNRRLSAADGSLNVAPGGGEGADLQDLLVDEEQDPEGFVAEADELEKRRDLLDEAFKTLSAREQQILRARTLNDEPRTLEDLSKLHGISRERVRQIQARAIDRLRERVLAAANTDIGGAGQQVLASAA